MEANHSMHDPRMVDLATGLSRAAGAVVGLASALMLGAHGLSLQDAPFVSPIRTSTDVVNALILVVTGTVLALPTRGAAKRMSWRGAQVARGLVAALVALSLIVSLEASGWNLTPFWFGRDPSWPFPSPQRAAPLVLISFGLLALAQCLSDARPLASQRMATLVSLLALFTLFRYAFEAHALNAPQKPATMPIDTALALVVLGIGTVAARPTQGYMAVLVSDTSAGMVARRLLLLAPLLPGLSWLVYLGRRAAWYEEAFGWALLLLSGMALVVALTMGLTRRLYLADVRKKLTRQRLAVLNAQLELAVEERSRRLELLTEKLLAENAERRRAEEEVRQLSLTDELTGLWNRRGFMLLAEQNLKAARRDAKILTLFYIDLDGFKEVNDRLGHAAGDALLCEAARLLKDSLRETDIVSRLGGDEFAALAENNAQDDAVLGRLLANLERFNALSPTPLSFSIGTVHCLPASTKTLPELLADADARMYREKQLRRATRQRCPTVSELPAAAILPAK